MCYTTVDENFILFSILFLSFLGQAGPSDVIQHGMSQVVVETVTKTSIMSKFSALPKFQSEASRVTCEGNGLKKAFRGKQATFNVDVTNGGKFYITCNISKH